MSFLADTIKFLKAIVDSGINISALITILILVYFAWHGIYKENSRFSQYAKNAPSILATVGIFFSFLGIALALINFDTNNIDGSIPSLLDGLKSKFMASLMGMFFSIIVKIMQVYKIKDSSIMSLDREKEMIDLLSNLLESNKNNNQQLLPELAKQNVLLESIKNSLVGDEDSSVITQLKLVKSEINNLDKNSTQNFTNSIKYNAHYISELNKAIQDGFKNQIDKFDEFSKILAENNSKAFIEALEKAMRDFNNNITEQFGENFKELNRAVGDLLKWQDNYKVHIERLQQNFQITLDSIKIIENSFGDIQSRSEKFTVTSENLHVILEGLDSQLKDLNNHLKAFDVLASNAKDAFPRIEDNLTKLTSGFRNSTEQSLFAITNTVTIMRNAMNEQKDALTSTSQDFKTVTKNLTRETKESIDNYRDSLQQTIQNYERELQRVVQEQMNHIGNAVKVSSEQFNKLLIENTTKSTGILEQQTDHLDRALQEELKKSIETMGKHLAALSNKFVSDYSPLTEKLKEVVRLAEDLRRGRNS